MQKLKLVDIIYYINAVPIYCVLYSLVHVADERGGRDETDHESNKIGDLYYVCVYISYCTLEFN